MKTSVSENNEILSKKANVSSQNAEGAEVSPRSGWSFSVAYVAIFLSVAFGLRIFYGFLHSWGFESVLSRSWYILIADTLLVTSPFVLFRRWRWLVFIPVILLCTLMLAILWYNRQFETLLPLRSLGMANNFTIAMPSIPRLIRPMDFLTLIPLVMILSCFLLRKKIQIVSVSARRFFLMPIIVGPTIVLASFYGYAMWHPNPKMTSPSFLGYIQKMTNLSGVQPLPYIGISGYITAETVNAVIGDRISDADLKEVQAFLKERRQSWMVREPNVPDAASGAATVQVDGMNSANPNLIVIVVESFSAWVVDRKIGDTEITPVINRLMREPSSFSTRKVLSQIRDGNSSDGYHILNTGLLPINRGATVRYHENFYGTIPRYLKDQRGYRTLQITAASAQAWNQNLMYATYDYESILDCVTLVPDQSGNADQQMFRHVLPILEKMPEPFMTQIVTLSSHTPWTHEHIRTEYGADDMDTEERYYFCNAMTYEDHCVGEFLESLKSSGLYDRSVIVITADHAGLGGGRFTASDSDPMANTYVPLLILNCPVDRGLMDQVERSEHVYGQIDIFPTILRVMGLADVPFRGVGTDIFENTDDCAIYRTGAVAGGNRDPAMVEKKQKLWKISDTMIRSDYLRNHLQIGQKSQTP